MPDEPHYDPGQHDGIARSHTRDQVLRRLRASRACKPALRWVRSQHRDATALDLWRRCPDGAWMAWLLTDPTEVRGAPNKSFFKAALAADAEATQKADVPGDYPQLYAKALRRRIPSPWARRWRA